MIENAIKAAKSAFSEVSDDDENVSVPLPPFQVSARIAVGAAALDAAVHGWDIAKSYGKSVVFSDELATELLHVAQQIVEPLRQFGVYASAIDAPKNATKTEELLCFLGRRP